MSASLVGSEMCIRDRPAAKQKGAGARHDLQLMVHKRAWAFCAALRHMYDCLLYTSDAADDM
eukprot:8703071-Alexandrium_andersonii.AAC.1